ncbi:FAD-binding oxidoreductase [Taibaiella soli]|uniref:FAD-binding oxidoreductase n=1 Tax=Taibaiella soli TaxID=1649169 RepID=A0A2W2AAC1_9BACT|nr:FAD-linked oxidase C-terminal domain-containing protein [Taibaiella soli]PZF72231.1 FAD-binding oxidoreductase [Taibaiella soli]
MSFSKIQSSDITFFQSLSDVRVLTDEENLKRCASDETEDLTYLPEIVLQPETVPAVSQIMRYCNEHNIPVTPRGAGTGLSGGALAIMGGVVLDMKRFNKIVNMDMRNLQVTVEPGMITQELQDFVKEKGLFYPPDPASKGSCFIGGNVSENSGGPRAVKYGVVKDYVLNLEMVLADGSVIWTGANVLKNATGYNLTQLVVGSEGTLGVITKIVLRLIPAVQHDMLMLVPFRKAEEACAAVNAIFMAGYTPSAMEFMERDALEWSMKYVQSSGVSLPDDIAAHLLIEVDGNHYDQLYKEMEAIGDIVQQYDIDEILFADSAEQKQMLWTLRRKVGEAVKSNSIYKEEDTVVPRAELPELLRIIKQLGKEYGFESVCYGHAGDGNLHVNIVKGNMSDSDWNEKLPQGIKALFKEVIRMGGTISGEHGIGLVQKEYMNIAFNDIQLGLMKQIKNIFDPKGILNPGKIFLS